MRLTPCCIILPLPLLPSIYIHKYYMNLLWWNYTYTTHPPSSDWRVFNSLSYPPSANIRGCPHSHSHPPWPIQEPFNFQGATKCVFMFGCTTVCVLGREVGVYLPPFSDRWLHLFFFFSSHPITEWKLISRFRHDLWTLGSGISTPPSTHTHTHTLGNSGFNVCLVTEVNGPPCNNLPSRHPYPDKLRAWWGWRPHTVGRDL